MNGASSRRGFLRGLTTLPLIGGGVTLIGAPSAVAEPLTQDLLNAYSEWLFQERRILCREMHPTAELPWYVVPHNTGATDFHFPSVGSGIDFRDVPPPSTGAALVLSAVGCNWRD